MSKNKNTLKQFNTINALAMTESITSSVTDIRFLDDIGIQFTWSGAAVGTFSIDVSANYNQDYEGNVLNAGNWVPLTLTYFNGSANITANSLPTTLGSPIYVDLALLSSPWIRERYTFASESGTLTTTITAKEL